LQNLNHFKVILLIPALTICLFHKASSQVIWTVPAFPTKLDDVTIYYDATKGNGALAGFQGDVFAHTGVITSESVNGNDWKHVIGNWGSADARVLMTRVAPDLYSISFNISDFYNIPAAEEVLKMAFVFRNVNGSIVGREADGADIFTNVYPSNPGLYFTLKSPVARDVIIFEDDSLFVNILVSDTAELKIFDNGQLVFIGTTEQAQFYLHPHVTGKHWITFEATTDTTIVLQKDYFIIEKNPVKINPPAGTVNGINYFTDSTYLFRIYAPLKKYVFLLTPQNLYSAETDYQMHVGDDNASYWVEIPRSWFQDSMTTYQYLMDNAIRVADPHAEVVLDPSSDAWIEDSVMMTLPAYPTGLTSGIVTAFDKEKEIFDFQVDHFDKPRKTNLVIYELLIRDFLANHSYQSMIDTLDYFVRLGVTAIELMPISEFEGNISWGYNQSFHMAVDKYYGTREKLKSFVDAAHQRGIGVILDVVFNHTFSQGPLAQMYWDPVNGRPAANSPYLNAVARHPFNVGYDFNHESIATKNWVKRILSYWITDFKFDGFRFDLSKGLTQFNSGSNAALMSRYDASRIAILKDYANHIWSVDSNSYVILEHFADNDEETELANYGMMLWGNMNYQFSQAAKGFQSDLEWADYTVRGWNDPHIVAYMESHDEERMMYRLLHEGSSEGDYNTRHLQTALERVAAASAIFYSIPGPKMIWEFGELGYDYAINTCVNGTISNDCRLDPKPIRWDYLNDYYRAKLQKEITSLLYLKNNYPTFSTDDFLFNDGNLYLKTVHLNHPDMDAVTLVNFRVIHSDINPKFQHTGTWYEYFTGDSLVVTDTQKKLTFAPGEYRIYTSKRLVPPVGYFTTSTSEATIPEIALYPNLITHQDPVYGFLNVQVKIESVHISDLNGVQIPDYDLQILDGGFSLTFPEELSPGIYFISVKSEGGYFIGKIIKP
jgi:hypothetical protein